jgi:8-oxo-dGTP pyrophosphatase MutT (NUDIX family)
LITFDEGSLRFVYRVAGVAIDKGRVLLETVGGQDFWFLPGGRGEFLEPSQETLRREMIEEIHTRVKVGRLLWVVENFFSGKDLITAQGMSVHEIGFYFLMELPKNSRLRRLETFPGDEEGFEVTFGWHRLDKLKKIRVLPSFLQTELKRIPDGTKHIVHQDK